MRFAFALVMLAACADAGDGDYNSAEPAPLLGVDGSLDQADRNCHVVLRDLERSGSGFTLETSGSSWVWQGTIEISEAAAAAEGLVPSAMYRMAPSGSWSSVTATPVTGTPSPATPGYVRFAVRMTQGLPGPGWSGTSLSNARIEVVPLLAMPAGGRLFDHNRNAGELDNYLMTSTTGLAIWTDPTACAPPAGPTRARLVFDADFSERREGVLAPGGELSIVFDPARLPTCRNWRNGNPLYDITAHVLFTPGQQRRDASVRDGAANMSVPTDARGATVWFENTGIPGCQTWDSNMGANYYFAALVPPQWIGEARSLITRGGNDGCDGGTAASAPFLFDSWARQRAAITNLCFQVYEPGMTDHDDPDLWQKLDVQLHYRYIGATTGAWQQMHVNFDRRTGNNARYASTWRSIDPLRSYHCPEVTPTTVNGSEVVRIEYYLVVNGGELRPQPGAAYAGQFSDDPNAWRNFSCH